MNGRHSGDDSSAGSLMLIENESGTLVIGDPEEIEQWIASSNVCATSVQQVDVLPANLLGNISNIMGAASELTQVLVSPKPSPVGTSSELRVVTRDLSTGRFVSNVGVDPRLLMTTSPQGAMVYASLQAVQLALEEITETLEDVAQDVQELLNYAHAGNLGDVYGNRKFLKQRLNGYQQDGVLATADWESIAGLGPHLETGIEKLRQYLLLEFQDLDPEDNPSKRAGRLTKKLKNGRWVGTFKLLLAAQDSLAVWHQLRLVRISHQEPQHLESAVGSARNALNANLQEDQELAARISEVIDTYCTIHADEVFGQGLGTKKKLDGARRELEKTTRDFLRYRGLQAEGWGLLNHARLGDGFLHIRNVAGDTQREMRKGVSKGLKFLASKIDADEPETKDE